MPELVVAIDEPEFDGGKDMGIKPNDQIPPPPKKSSSYVVSFTPPP